MVALLYEDSIGINRQSRPACTVTPDFVEAWGEFFNLTELNVSQLELVCQDIQNEKFCSLKRLNIWLL